MAQKVKIKLNKGKATIEEGGNTLIGKLLANHEGKIKFKTPRAKGEFEVVKKVEAKPKKK